MFSCFLYTLLHLLCINLNSLSLKATSDLKGFAYRLVDIIKIFHECVQQNTIEYLDKVSFQCIVFPAG